MLAEIIKMVIYVTSEMQTQFLGSGAGSKTFLFPLSRVHLGIQVRTFYWTRGAGWRGGGQGGRNGGYEIKRRKRKEK